MSTDHTSAPTGTRPRRLTPTTRVAMPSATRLLLSALGFVAGVAIALVGGATPGLVVTLGLVLLAASFVLGRLRDRARAATMPIVLASTASIPMVSSGPPNILVVLTFVGAALFGHALGTADRARREAREPAAPPTDPATVPGRTVLTWRTGRERFEVVDPSEKRLRTVIRGPKGNVPSSIDLRRDTAGLDVLRPADVPVAVLHATDVRTGPWYEIVDAVAAPGPGQAVPARLSPAAYRDRAVDAAVHFARTGEPLPSATWAPTARS